MAGARSALDGASEESHTLQVRLTEASGSRRSIVERVEAEWHRPFEQLLDGAPLLDLDIDTLEAESARVTGALEAIGPVNPLAVEEHAEETKRMEFLSSQRDDLVGARQSLIQAIREIDGTARSMFLETFTAVQSNFSKVFQTLFGGGECELRLANPDDPLESEIDIHAAPRGKRTQRIHLLSSGERTLVAVSLLFSIYLTKPSPFCLMDEVDAPLDDANVGRFTRLLDEFKADTQFLVITHNPRTMQSADAVYGVTMQEPGISTIVGVASRRARARMSSRPMLIVMRHGADEAEIRLVVATIEEMGYQARPMPGKQRMSIGLVGNDGRVDGSRLAALPGVQEIIHVTKPYKQVSREWKAESTIVRLPGGLSVGGDDVVDHGGAMLGRERAPDPRCRAHRARGRAPRCFAPARSSRAARPIPSRDSATRALSCWPGRGRRPDCPS